MIFGNDIHVNFQERALSDGALHSTRSQSPIESEAFELEAARVKTSAGALTESRLRALGCVTAALAVALVLQNSEKNTDALPDE
jgi:hypothetical protein